MEDNTYRRVAHVEEFIIRDVHEKDVLHGGYKKTFEKVWCHVAHVSVNEYVFLCSVAEFVSWDPKMRG